MILDPLSHAGETKMRRTHKHESRPKLKQDLYQSESDPYDDYSDRLDDDFDSMSDLAPDFYSTDCEGPSQPKRRISARRRIERRNDLKDLITEFGGWDDLDRKDDWWD